MDFRDGKSQHLESGRMRLPFDHVLEHVVGAALPPQCRLGEEKRP